MTRVEKLKLGEKLRIYATPDSKQPAIYQGELKGACSNIGVLFHLSPQADQYSIKHLSMPQHELSRYVVFNLSSSEIDIDLQGNEKALLASGEHVVLKGGVLEDGNNGKHSSSRKVVVKRLFNGQRQMLRHSVWALRQEHVEYVFYYDLGGRVVWAHCLMQPEVKR